MSVCPRCHHDEALHAHLRDGGCAGRVAAKDPKIKGTAHCGCIAALAAPDLDDPSDETLEHRERRDDELRREEAR